MHVLLHEIVDAKIVDAKIYVTGRGMIAAADERKAEREDQHRWAEHHVDAIIGDGMTERDELTTGTHETEGSSFPPPASRSTTQQQAGAAAVARIGTQPATLETTTAPTLHQIRAGEAKLHLGHKGAAVGELAFLLGESTSRELFDEHLLHRVQAYQRSVGMHPVTGEVGKSTMLALSGGASSKDGAAQMSTLADYAKKQAGGSSPGGKCYASVASYIEHCGYGLIENIDRDIPGDQSYAVDFSYNVEKRGPAKVGLRRLHVSSPYDAPRGAIIVVLPGSPGTSNPVAGDITVRGDGGAFYNDGLMDYGGRDAWPPKSGGVLAVYVPL